MTATPWGFRDILPEEAQAREEIALTVKGCFREHHYLPVETPLLEDKGSLEEGGRIADTPFKLFDDDGRLLVVRPDNTLPIVRLVSTRMRAADLPLRLRYEAPVVRECQRNASAASSRSSQAASSSLNGRTLPAIMRASGSASLRIASATSETISTSPATSPAPISSRPS